MLYLLWREETENLTFSSAKYNYIYSHAHFFKYHQSTCLSSERFVYSNLGSKNFGISRLLLEFQKHVWYFYDRYKIAPIWNYNFLSRRRKMKFKHFTRKSLDFWALKTARPICFGYANALFWHFLSPLSIFQRHLGRKQWKWSGGKRAGGVPLEKELAILVKSLLWLEMRLGASV